MDRKPVIAFRGATNGATFRGQPEGFSPFGARRDFRARNPSSDRPGGGRRQCLRKLVARQLKDAAVNGLISVSRASAIAGQSLGTCEDMGDATSVSSGVLAGNIAALDDVPSMDWFSYLDVTGTGGPAANTVSACAWDPDGEFLAVATNYTVGGDGRFTIARINPTNGAVVWQTESKETGYDRFANAVVVTKLYTFVAIANTHAGGPRLIGYRNDTGAQAYITDLNGWANQGVALAKYTNAAGQEFLFIAYDGSAAAGTYVPGLGSGVIRLGRWALQFRSAIRKYSVNGTAYTGTVLTRAAFGTPTPAGEAYYEDNHGDWRLSEQSPFKPHGGEFTALACGSDGSVYFTKRNQGWGPNSGDARFQPDGNYEPYWTVGKISAAGVLEWWADTDSIRELDDLGFYNDLTFPGEAPAILTYPSIQAICVDADGNCYVAGRRNAAGVSAFALNDEGVLVWAANVQSATGFIAEGAAAVDSDGNPIFAGVRNDDWDGADPGDNAIWWKLLRTTGEVLETFDIEENVSALCVACAGDGRTFFGTDAV